jgi:hypothetical protein
MSTEPNMVDDFMLQDDIMQEKPVSKKQEHTVMNNVYLA